MCQVDRGGNLRYHIPLYLAGLGVCLAILFNININLPGTLDNRETTGSMIREAILNSIGSNRVDAWLVAGQYVVTCAVYLVLVFLSMVVFAPNVASILALVHYVVQ